MQIRSQPVLLINNTGQFWWLARFQFWLPKRLSDDAYKYIYIYIIRVHVWVVWNNQLLDWLGKRMVVIFKTGPIFVSDAQFMEQYDRYPRVFWQLSIYLSISLFWNNSMPYVVLSDCAWRFPVLRCLAESALRFAIHWSATSCRIADFDVLPFPCPPTTGRDTDNKYICRVYRYSAVSLMVVWKALEGHWSLITDLWSLILRSSSVISSLSFNISSSPWFRI